MPKLETETVVTNNFQFSHAKLANLDATEYTTFRIDVDTSGSTRGFERKEEELVKAIYQALGGLGGKHPRAKNLLVSLNTFDSSVEEVHGYVPITSIEASDIDNQFSAGGRTCLLDTLVSGSESLYTFGQTLVDQDYDVNGIHVIITDGYEYGSKHSYGSAKTELARTKTGEDLESCLTIVILINENSSGTAEMKKKLEEIGIDQFIEAGAFDEDAFKRITGFVSSSVSTQQANLGTGQSQILTF